MIRPITAGPTDKKFVIFTVFPGPVLCDEIGNKEERLRLTRKKERK